MTEDADVLIYHLCRQFNYLPSDIEREDPAMMARLAYIDYVVETNLKSKKNA